VIKMSKSINPRSRWEIILDILDVIEMSENDPSRGMVYGLTKEGKELRAKLKGLGAVLQ
jgi:predicted transcriptional regulator